MKRMMINATQSEELRVAIADGQKLLDLDIETPAHEQKKANIYKARITRVERSLEACFVDYGVPRHGFLPFKEINPDALEIPESDKKGSNIKDLLKEGQELIVQVEKEERGTKGAALSTYISLAGRYSVLMPTNPGSGGVSRRISGPERNDLRALLDQLNLPEEMGLIIRTAGMGRDASELQWDIDYLVQLWQAIKSAAAEHKAPLLIYQESNLFIRALRDYLRDDITEILVDDQDVYNKAVEFMQMVMPHNLRKLKLYEGETPLFTRFQIESQIETAFAREVRLPSGGALVIDHTEALLSIDINSARSTKGADIEETALQTNLEAADEISRQLKIRDLGGLVVIDFIDMSKRSSQRKVEERLAEALNSDRARIQIGRISRFGLLEMSRQRMRPSLGDSSYETCPRCLGSGSIRSVESLALSIIRLLEEDALKDNTGQIQVQVPNSVANFMLNEKRDAITVIEQRHGVQVLVLANQHMRTPHYEIKRLRANEIEEAPSYEQVLPVNQNVETISAAQTIANRPKAVVDRIHPAAPAPVRKGTKAGLLQSLFAFFAGEDNSRKQADHKAGDTKAGNVGKPANRSRIAGSSGPSPATDKRDDASSRRGASPSGKKTRSRKRPAKKAPGMDQPGSSQQQASSQPNNQPNKQPDTDQGNELATAAGRGRKKAGKKTTRRSTDKSATGASGIDAGGSSTGQSSAEQEQGNQVQINKAQTKPEPTTATADSSGDSFDNKPRRRGKRGGRRRRGKQDGNIEQPQTQASGDNNRQNQNQNQNQNDNHARSQNDNRNNSQQAGQSMAQHAGTGDEQRQQQSVGADNPAKLQAVDAAKSARQPDSLSDNRSEAVTQHIDAVTQPASTPRPPPATAADSVTASNGEHKEPAQQPVAAASSAQAQAESVKGLYVLPGTAPQSSAADKSES